MTDTQQRPPVLIKRYAQSRLYDTVTTRYLTVDELKAWAAEGIPFVVRDADTGQDVTRVLLA